MANPNISSGTLVSNATQPSKKKRSVARSPVVLAWEEIRKEYKAENRLASWEAIKPFFLRTKGTRGGRPTPLSHALLMGIKGVSGDWLYHNIEGELVNKVTSVGLMEKLPPVPRREKTKYLTAIAGYSLMEYWKETDKKFQLFYDAFYNKNAHEEAKAYASSIAIGIEPPSLSKRNKMIEEYKEKVNKEEEERQKIQAEFVKMQNEMMKKAGLGNQYNSLNPGGLFGNW